MAAYARLYSSVWKTDFTGLTHGAQWLYVALISQPDISNAGVLALTRGRWGTLSADTDADSVQSFLDELAADDKVFCDQRTEEVWVRSYIRYDGLAKTNPNGLTSVRRAVAAILSPTLRELAANELATVSEGVDRTGSSPQQPAAASRDQQPAAAAVPVAELPAAAAEALSIYVAWRESTERNIRTPSRWRASLNRTEAAAHGARLVVLAGEGKSASEIAAEVWAMDESAVITGRHYARKAS